MLPGVRSYKRTCESQRIEVSDLLNGGTLAPTPVTSPNSRESATVKTTTMETGTTVETGTLSEITGTTTVETGTLSGITFSNCHNCTVHIKMSN